MSSFHSDAIHPAFVRVSRHRNAPAASLLPANAQFKRVNFLEKTYAIKHLAIATIFTILLSISPAIAQSTSSETFREYSDGKHYFNYGSDPNLCSGQVLDDGLICVIDLLEEQRPEDRLASLIISNLNLGISTHIRVFEVDPNEANIVYVVLIHDIIPVTDSNVPRLLATVRSDGTLSVDPDYGEYPPQFSAEEESRSMVERYQGEIRRLISALVQTQ